MSLRRFQPTKPPPDPFSTMRRLSSDSRNLLRSEFLSTFSRCVETNDPNEEEILERYLKAIYARAIRLEGDEVVSYFDCMIWAASVDPDRAMGITDA